LCRTYWKPLYAFLRRRGLEPSDAQDLVQGLFLSLLKRNGLAAVEPSRGRFRSFLLASLKHFMSNERDKVEAQKRGGRYSFVSLEETQAEEEGLASPGLTPEQAYEQSWALALIEHSIGRLREEYAAAGRAELFRLLEPCLSNTGKAPPYAEVAARTGLGESGVKMAVQRMRRRFGEVLRNEVGHTVSKPQEVDEEIRALFATLRR
jgi:RNA polymerase sigma factor (sigma-70 family)